MRVGMVAGEASGDLLASHLIAALKARRGGMLFAGIGGPRMAGEGFESLYPMEKLSVRGYAEVLRNYAEIMGIRRRLAKSLIEERPDLFIGVDSGDFNLGLERQLKQAGIPTIHYVSPSVWAWRGWRVKKIAREKSVEDIEKLFIHETLKRHGWNVTRSAEETGMQRANFQALMKKYNIRVRDTEPGSEEDEA